MVVVACHGAISWYVLDICVRASMKPAAKCVVVYFEVKMKSLSIMGFNKFPCSLPNVTLFNKSNDYRGMGQTPAGSGNCFTVKVLEPTPCKILR